MKYSGVTGPNQHGVGSRRRFLGQAAGLGGTLLAHGLGLHPAFAQAPCADVPAGDLVRVLPLYGIGGVDTPLGQRVGGTGLDARQFTDLAVLGPDALITPTADVFVRTAAPANLPRPGGAWTINRRGRTEDAPTPIAVSELVRRATPQGTHLIECAGNSNPQNFGLMSAADWRGVPLVDVLADVPPPAGAAGVLVSGIDDETQQSLRSEPGASWVFPAADLVSLAPFLATHMNGEPLTRDHGAPVRLVVPGWYGCAWIKWVDEIRWVRGDEPATAQMREFAARTHQNGMPALARDYAPPAIDTAAMPIRVEQRRVDGHVEYDVVGIVWGGSAPVDRLTIRFGSRDRGEPVRICPAPVTHRTWNLWRHRWRPVSPGYYDIALKVADPAVRTRRLDLSFYIRRVRIDDV